MIRSSLIAVGCVFGVGALAVALRAQPQSFDKLSKEDRAVFQQRFTKEIWPLMQRNGKAGCVGCHSGGIVTALKLKGDADKDFAMLVREGFFLPDDAGSLLGRITDKDASRRMPRSKSMPWTSVEIKLLSDFVKDMDSKQQK